MFTYKETIEERTCKIEAYLIPEQAGIAVILAAANFEWTLRRAILVLGRKPTKELRMEIQRTSSLDRYRELWKETVFTDNKNALPRIVKNWPVVNKAYNLRHKLVHGEQGTTGLEYARERVSALLLASEALNIYVTSKGKALYGVRIKRLKTRAQGKK